MLTWIIYNRKIECCLCRSNKFKFSIEDITSYNIDNIEKYNINKNTFANNLNEILNEILNDNVCIIQINDNDSVNESTTTIESNQFLRKRKLKNLLILILIPIFYIILYFIIPYVKNNDDTNNYIDY